MEGMEEEDDEFGSCDYCVPDDDDEYNCFCATCNTPMCNSEILVVGRLSSSSGRVGGVQDLLLVVLLAILDFR